MEPDGRLSDGECDPLEEAGIPAEVRGRLQPIEERLLAHVIRNRHRMVSDEELAEVLFGQPLAGVRREIERSRYMAAMLVARYGVMKAGFVSYRGTSGVGVRWESRDTQTPRPEEQAAGNS